MHSIINQHLDELKVLCAKLGVVSFSAFGSVCTSEFNVNSDLDFLVSFKQMDVEVYADNYFKLVDELEALFNRPVDLITENSLFYSIH